MDALDDLARRFRAENDVPAGILLAKTLRDVGRVDEAVALINDLSRRDLPPILKAHVGIVAQFLGLYELSVDLLTAAIPELEGEYDQLACGLDLAAGELALGRHHLGHPRYAQTRAPYWLDLSMRMTSPDGKNWWAADAGKLLFDQPVAGKRIVVVYESGYGDLFQFLRYADCLHIEGAASIVFCAPETVKDLVQSKAHVTFAPRIPSPFTWDYFCPIFSLYARYQTRADSPHWDEPYLKCDPGHALPVKVQAALETSDGRPRVGVIWRSATAARHEPYRSMTLSVLEPLLANPAVRWMSLQVDGLSVEERSLLDTHAVTHLGDDLRSFQDTAHVLARIDLLISIDSAAVHLAGALGHPVWALLSRWPDHRWYNDERFTPWYPSVRLYRQQRLGDWGNVIADVTQAIAGLQGPA
jgi:hypothetical protein